MRTQNVNAPRLEISLRTARPGILVVYSGLQENQQAQVYGSCSHYFLSRHYPCTISIPAKVSNRLSHYWLSYTDNIAKRIKPVHSCQGQSTFLDPPFWVAEQKILHMQEACRQEKCIGPM